MHFLEENIDFAKIQFKHLCLGCKNLWKENNFKVTSNTDYLQLAYNWSGKYPAYTYVFKQMHPVTKTTHHFHQYRKPPYFLKPFNNFHNFAELKRFSAAKIVKS